MVTLLLLQSITLLLLQHPVTGAPVARVVRLIEQGMLPYFPRQVPPGDPYQSPSSSTEFKTGWLELLR